MVRHGGYRVEGAGRLGEEGLVVVTVDQRLGHLVRGRGRVRVRVRARVWVRVRDRARARDRVLGVGVGAGLGHHTEARLLGVG